MAIISVTLFVESEHESVESLTAEIGVPASGSWRKGEQRGKTSKTYATNSWKQTEKVEAPDEPDQFLTALHATVVTVLSRMSGHERQFSQVASSSTSGLLIAISSRDVPPLVLSPDLVRQIALLGVSCEVDLTLN